MPILIKKEIDFTTLGFLDEIQKIFEKHRAFFSKDEIRAIDQFGKWVKNIKLDIINNESEIAFEEDMECSEDLQEYLILQRAEIEMRRVLACYRKGIG